MIQHVPPHLVMMAWPQLQRAFRKAQGSALGDRLDEVAILKGLCEGLLDLFIAAEDEILGGVILEYVKRRKGKCCIVMASLFNSYPPDWAEQMNQQVIDYAKNECGCYTVEAFARDGVISNLEAMGWRRKATVMEVRI